MDLNELAGNPFAQLVAAVLSLAGGYKYWRSQGSSDAKERADNDGQIAALATWQQLLESERAARIKAEERADKFAAERNEAMQQVWEMRGQLKAMSDNLAAQTAQIAGLQDQVRQLKEQINAP